MWHYEENNVLLLTYKYSKDAQNQKENGMAFIYINS